MSRLCSSRFERAARKLGWMRIAGIDEAGRGALFGPVVAAAVILNPKRRIVGLDDSKKLASERREELAPRIREHALAWAVAEVDAQRIDAWNIYQASRQAMTAALQQLTIPPDYLLIDAMQLDVLIEQKSLIKGDARSISIAAAWLPRKRPTPHAVNSAASSKPKNSIVISAACPFWRRSSRTCATPCACCARILASQRWRW